jgi:hypothetical protein
MKQRPKSQYLSKSESFVSFISSAVSPSLSLAFVLWVVLWFLTILLTYVDGFFFGLPSPFNSPMPAPETRFGDFFGVFAQWSESKGLGGVGFGLSYFPATYIPVEIALKIQPDPAKILPFSQGVVILTIPLILWFLRSKGLLTGLTVAVMVAFSYPLLLILHTGNVEGWVAFGILLSAAMLWKKQYIWFSIALGVTASIKGVPLIFLGALLTLLPWRQVAKYTFITIATAVGLNAVALLVLPNGLIDAGWPGVLSAIESISESQRMYSDLMVESIAGMHFGHSILNAVHAFHGVDSIPSAIWALPIFITSLVLTTGALLWARFNKIAIPQWVLFLVLGSVACFAMPTSTDYKLAYLFPALLLFARECENDLIWTPTLILLIFSLSPKSWLRVSEDPYSTAMVYLTALGLVLLPFVAFFTLWLSSREKLFTEHPRHIG